MNKLYTYCVLIIILALPLNLTAQERKAEVKSLQELLLLEKGVSKVDEIEPFIYSVPDVADVQDVLFLEYGGNTRINLRKTLSKVDLSHTYTFNVEEKYSGIEFLIMGEMTEGSFKIKLIKPDKTIMKDINVTPGNNYEWHQPFTLDKVKKGGIGKWTVELTASEASGYFQFFCSSR